MNAVHKFKEKDTVYFVEGLYDSINRAEIVGFFENNGEPWAEIHCLDGFGTTRKPISDLFTSKGAAETAAKTLFEKEKHLYLSQISSVTDLLTFLFSHDTSSGECGNLAARHAVIEKAKELLDVNLENL